MVGENGEKYYGQLEEIMEVQYPYDYSTVIFRCKWFDTGDIPNDNFISIDTEKEAYQDDQLIYASQAKQVFYIREPVNHRRNQNNNPRCVVEHVNHRNIWDLPSDNARVQNAYSDSVQDVDNVEAENVDIVQNNSSSGARLFIDFSQYFQNNVDVAQNNVDYDDEDETEVPPPTGRIDNVSDEETDYDDDDSDYDTDEEDIEVYDEDSD